MRLCVDPLELQPVPYHFQQLVQVPLERSADGAIVGQLVQQFQLLQRDSIDLIEHVEAGNVHSRALDDVDQVVRSSIFSEDDVGVVDAVFAQNGLACVGVKVRVLDHGLKVDTALVFTPKLDVGGVLVQADPEAFQLVLDLLLVSDWFHRVEDDQDQVAGAGGTDHLSPATFAILGALDDTREVQKLDLRAFVAVAKEASEDGGITITIIIIASIEA